MVTNNIIVEFCGCSGQDFRHIHLENGHKLSNIKCVQTSFSPGDIINDKCSCHRKIRSQEDIKTQALKEGYLSRVAIKSCGERLHRLALKLTGPEHGEEDKIRKKVQKYLKFLGKLSDCDKNQERFIPSNTIKNIDINDNQQIAEVRKFVMNEITNITNKLNVSIKRLALVEDELHNALVEKLVLYDCETEENIFNILRSLGGLSNHQANYFTDVILKRFDQEYLKTINQCKLPKSCNLNQSKSVTGVTHYDTYSVYYSMSKIKPIFFTEAGGTKVTSNNNHDKAKLSTYKKEIITQIDKWLQKLDVQTTFPKSDRVRAMEDLADDVIDRIKYLKLNPNSKISDKNELQYLRYQIFKCIDKIIGEGTNVTIEHANELMDRIRRVQSSNAIKPIELTKTDNAIGLFKQNSDNDVNKGMINKNNNVNVYDFTLPSSSQFENYDEDKTKQINAKDIEASLQFYFQQLIKVISEWVRNLKVPQIYEEKFKNSAVNDLAGEIKDRHRCLILNPSSRGTDEEESEYLKNHILKWIDKLEVKSSQETEPLVQDLIRKIENVSVLMHVKQFDEKQSNSTNIQIKNDHFKDSTGYSKRQKKTLPRVTKNTKKSNTSNVNTKTSTNFRQSNFIGYSTNILNNDKINSKEPIKENNNTKNVISRISLQEPAEIPSGLGFDEVYPYFDNIYKQRVQEIPLEAPDPEQAMLADLARRGIYNGIWKTYFQLKADPEIENQYSYFELVFEEELDTMLNCLPQTEDMKRILPVWKSKLLLDVMNMLKYVHHLTDTPSFRQKLAEKFDRHFIKAQYQESSDLHQHGFVVRTADAYIIFSKYKEEDPIKANIYKQRLMKRIEELADDVKRKNNVEFRYINQAQLYKIALQILESVPLPQDESLKNEADEILLAEEIEEWYNILPVKPIRNETDEILRKRMREILAKKLCQLEKGSDINNVSTENEIKHEVSKFLNEKAELRQNEDLNIDFMVEELTNRMKTRKQRDMLGYETFAGNNPLASTFIETDPGEPFVPLVDIGLEDRNLNPPYIESIAHAQSVVHTGQIEDEDYFSADQRQSIPLRTKLGNQSIKINGKSRPNQNWSGNISGGEIDTSRFHHHLHGPQASNRYNINNSNVQMPTQSDQAHLSPLYQMDPRIDRGEKSLRGQSDMRGEGFIRDKHQHSETPRERPFRDRSDIPRHISEQEQLSVRRHRESSTKFVSGNTNPTGNTRSTARVASPSHEPEEGNDENEEGLDRFKCRCMERAWQCRGQNYGMNRTPRWLLIPFPCMYY